MNNVASTAVVSFANAFAMSSFESVLQLLQTFATGLFAFSAPMLRSTLGISGEMDDEAKSMTMLLRKRRGGMVMTLAQPAEGAGHR